MTESGVRAQLTVLVAATTSLVLIAFLVPLGLLLRSEAEQRAISAATLRAQSVAALVALGQGADQPAAADADGVRTTVFFGDGSVSGTSAARTPSVELAARGRAFTAEAAGGVEVLTPVQGLAEGTAVVRAFVPDEALHRGVLRTWAVLLLLGLTLFGLGLLLAQWLGRRLVGSVTALAGTADRLAGGDLTARVTPDGPREIRRVGEELNRLAARIGELLTAEREDVADLAHRLRTPVTALRLDVDSLRAEEERARLSADVDHLGRVVDEVIRTARRPVREGVRPLADLAGVAGERVAYWSALAEDTGRPVRCVLPDRPVPVRAAPEDLAAALDALLENAFTHTADEVALRVEVGATADGGGWVTIDDGGPGLPAGADGRGVSAAGTGLGLDIARRIAQSAGGAMRAGRGPLGGAQLRLEFPAAG
jgi:signal transduction histidine kinase